MRGLTLPLKERSMKNQERIIQIAIIREIGNSQHQQPVLPSWGL